MYLEDVTSKRSPDVAVELAMVRIRRRQHRRVLAGLALGQDGSRASRTAITEVLDIVEEDEATGAQTTVTELGRRLDVDQPRASKLVNLAVEAGLLERDVDPGDARRTVLRLTPAGQAHLEQVHQFRRSVFAAAMQSWSDAERETFAHLLTRFVTALDAPE
jgi:DNA-binding MarR family transcriptional regulator